MAKIKKVHIDLALERVKEDFKKQFPPDLETFQKKNVRYDTHKKKISVTHDFHFGIIPKVKIIAKREQWLKIYYGITRQTFRSIQEFISRCPRRKKEELRQYAKENPSGFQDDLFFYAQAANVKNPLYYLEKVFKRRKIIQGKGERGRKSEFSLRKKKYKVANMAIRLYKYLRSLRKEPQKKWPSNVKNFLKIYEISVKDLGSSLQLRTDIADAMARHFPELDFSEDRFWKTFVDEGRISFKLVGKLKPIDPEKDPYLKDFFEKFKD